MRIRFILALAIANLTAACLEREPALEETTESGADNGVTTAREPTPIQEGSNPSSNHDQTPPLADPERFAASLETWPQAYSAWERGYHEQIVLARLFAIARNDASPAELELSLERLGQTLSEFRNDWEPVLINELRRVSVPSVEPWVSQIDSRYAPPLAEALLDVGDWAALLRWTAWHDRGAGAEALSGPASVAAQSAEGSMAPADLPQAEPAQPAELGCEPISIDGEMVSELPSGTYEVSCEGESRVVLIRREGSRWLPASP